MIEYIGTSVAGMVEKVYVGPCRSNGLTIAVGPFDEIKICRTRDGRTVVIPPREYRGPAELANAIERAVPDLIEPLYDEPKRLIPKGA